MIGLYAAMHYYVVRSNSGVQVVRKSRPQADLPYLDVRQFTASQWREFPEVASAVQTVAAGTPQRLADLSQPSLAWAADPDWR